MERKLGMQIIYRRLGFSSEGPKHLSGADLQDILRDYREGLKEIAQKELTRPKPGADVLDFRLD